MVFLGGALLLAAAVATADDFTGEFEGRGGLYLELEGDGELYLGALQLGGEIYLCEARREGARLVGALEGDNGASPFTLRAEGGRLVLESEGSSYTLWPIGEVPEGAGGTETPEPGGRTRGDGGGGGPPRETAGPEGRAGKTALAGRWRGTVAGTPAVLTLEAEGSRLSGRLDVSGYPYDLQGTLSGAGAQGQGTDLQTGGSFGFEATAAGETLDFVLVSRDPRSGMPQRQQLAFRRAGAEVGPGDGDTGTGSTGRNAGVPAGPRDPALVGVWRQSESMSSGDASMVVETFLQISADGTWAMGGGRAVGGGAGWGGDTGSGGVQETGYWKSENRIVYVQSPGTGQWRPFARYYVEPGKLMFTFGDSTRQVLYRVR